jgi:hypothetical protein
MKGRRITQKDMAMLEDVTAVDILSAGSQSMQIEAAILFQISISRILVNIYYKSTSLTHVSVPL